MHMHEHKHMHKHMHMPMHMPMHMHCFTKLFRWSPKHTPNRIKYDALPCVTKERHLSGTAYAYAYSYAYAYAYARAYANANWVVLRYPPQ